MGVGGQRHALDALLQGKTLVTPCTGGWVGPRARVREISPPTWILCPDRPARSKSLIRLSYPGPRGADIHPR